MISYPFVLYSIERENYCRRKRSWHIVIEFFCIYLEQLWKITKIKTHNVFIPSRCTVQRSPFDVDF